MTKLTESKAWTGVTILVLFVVSPVSGNLIIADNGKSCVYEVNDITKNIVWEYCGFGTIYGPNALVFPTYAMKLDNGNVLVANTGGNKVIEVNYSCYDPNIYGWRHGFNESCIIWTYLSNKPTTAVRLNNGNTLIAESGNNWVVEVDSGGNLVWTYAEDLNEPNSAVRSADNTKTLIVDKSNERVLLVDNANNKVAWMCYDLPLPTDAVFTSQGNVLITSAVTAKITEYKLNLFTPDIESNSELWNKLTDVLNQQSRATLEKNLTMYMDTIDPTNVEYYEAQQEIQKYLIGTEVVYMFNQELKAAETEKDSKIKAHVTQTYNTSWTNGAVITDEYFVTFKNINGLWKDSGTDYFRNNTLCSGEDVVWDYSTPDLAEPHRAVELPNGNILVTNTLQSEVIEVDRSRNIVWRLDDPTWMYIYTPYSALLTPGTPGNYALNVIFEYNVTDNIGSKVSSCSLYTDITRQWGPLLIDYNLPFGRHSFVVPRIYPGQYSWNVNCTDETGNPGFLSDTNWGFTVS